MLRPRRHSLSQADSPSPASPALLQPVSACTSPDPPGAMRRHSHPRPHMSRSHRSPLHRLTQCRLQLCEPTATVSCILVAQSTGAGGLWLPFPLFFFLLPREVAPILCLLQILPCITQACMSLCSAATSIATACRRSDSTRSAGLLVNKWTFLVGGFKPTLLFFALSVANIISSG